MVFLGGFIAYALLHLYFACPNGVVVAGFVRSRSYRMWTIPGIILGPHEESTDIVSKDILMGLIKKSVVLVWQLCLNLPTFEGWYSVLQPRVSHKA